MRLVVISARTVIDGVIRERGELVNVPDGWTENVKREIGRVDVKQVETARKGEIIAIEKEKKEREKPKGEPKDDPPVDQKPKDEKPNGKIK